MTYLNRDNARQTELRIKKNIPEEMPFKSISLEGIEKETPAEKNVLISVYRDDCNAE